MLFFVSVVLPSALPAADAAGAAPVAEAGLGLIAYGGDTVILDGSGSSDPEGDPLTYTWAQVGGPPTELQGGDTSQPQFTVSAAGTLRYALVVNDGLTDSVADTVEVVVPYQQIDSVEAGCATTPTAVSALLGLAGLLALGRRRTR